MSDPVSLATARADKSGDCRDWSVLDALRAAIRDIESGEIKPDIVIVAFREKHDERKWSNFPMYCAGGTTLEIQGLLAKHFAIQMRGDNEE